MDFTLTDEQKMLLDSADRFVGDRLSIRSVEAEPGAIWEQLAELGWLALPLPEESGGFGAAYEDVVILMTALGRAVRTPPFVTNIVLAGTILERCLPAELCHALLEELAAGAAQVSLAHADSRAGRVSAQERGDGAFVLNGGKVLCYGAPEASALLVSARIGASEELALFLVDPATAGIAIDAYPTMAGGSAADLRFDNVVVEAGRKVLGGTAAQEALARAVDRATLANLAQAVGCLEAALETTAEYVKSREQFGQQLSGFQVIQHKLAAMFVEAQEARSALYFGLSQIESGTDARARAISLARTVIGEAGRFVTETGIQLHGGYGLTDEYEISHFYRKILTLDLQFQELR